MKGYRNEDLFGDGYTDPIEVAIYETDELANNDIVNYMLENSNLTEKHADYLQQIADEEIDEIDTDYLGEIIRSYIGDRNYCKWLCNTPEDVREMYMTLEGCDEDHLPDGEITEYDIPDDAIKLSDLGREGSLYVWKQ